jgi:hypothetical protein
MSAIVPFIPQIVAGAAAVSAGASVYSALKGAPKPPQAPKPPSQDTATNAALQQQQQLLRRRGVLANIYAGGAAPTPATASKTNLGD